MAPEYSFAVSDDVPKNIISETTNETEQIKHSRGSTTKALYSLIWKSMGLFLILRSATISEVPLVESADAPVECSRVPLEYSI